MVRHQRHLAGLRHPVELHTLDGLVGGVVEVGGVRIELPAAALRNMVELAFRRLGGGIALGVARHFLDRLGAPGTGDDVVGGSLAAQQVHRHRRELAHGAALHEQHLVAGRHVEQLAQVLFGLGRNRHEILVAMAHFHHRHAAAVPVEQLGLDLLQHAERKCSGPCAEVKYSIHFSLLRDKVKVTPGSPRRFPAGFPPARRHCRLRPPGRFPASCGRG